MSSNKTRELEFGGMSFGISGGVITTLGMIVGLDQATSSKPAIIAAILTIAIADSLSDALGMHLSEETRLDEKVDSNIWLMSIFTFLGKFVFSLIFVVPFLILSMSSAVLFSVVAGLMIIVILAWAIAARRKISILSNIFEHLLLSLVVVAVSYFVGKFAHSII